MLAANHLLPSLQQLAYVFFHEVTSATASWREPIRMQPFQESLFLDEWEARWFVKAWVLFNSTWLAESSTYICYVWYFNTDLICWVQSLCLFYDQKFRRELDLFSFGSCHELMLKKNNKKNGTSLIWVKASKCSTGLWALQQDAVIISCVTTSHTEVWGCWTGMVCSA